MDPYPRCNGFDQVSANHNSAPVASRSCAQRASKARRRDHEYCSYGWETIIVGIDARIHDGFVVVDQDRAQVSSEYLALALAFLKRVFVAQGQTGTQANINSAIVRSTLMAVPSLAEQKRVTARLDAADESISTAVGELRKLILVKTGLMDDLLTGKVRVSDDHGSAV